jgi:hypothetical protein
VCVVAFGDGAALLTHVVRERPNGLRCATAFSPILDLGSAPPPFWGEQASETRRRYSLAPLIESGAAVPPMLVLIGAGDAERVTGGARRLAALGRERGLPIELLEHPTGGAAFDRGASGARTEELVRAWLAFLRRSLE